METRHWGGGDELSKIRTWHIEMIVLVVWRGRWRGRTWWWWCGWVQMLLIGSSPLPPHHHQSPLLHLPPLHHHHQPPPLRAISLFYRATHVSVISLRKSSSSRRWNPWRHQSIFCCQRVKIADYRSHSKPVLIELGIGIVEAGSRPSPNHMIIN